MKNVMMTTAIVGFISTAAVAENFDNNVFATTVTSGALDFSVEATQDDVVSFTTGATIADYAIGDFDTTARTSLGYNRLDETLTFAIAYNAQTDLTDRITAYGTAEVSYTTAAADLSAGTVEVAPTLGAKYAVNDVIDLFADVTYEWDASNDFARLGGYAEVGADYAIARDVTITPSVVQTFDAAEDAANLRIEVAFAF